MDCSVLKRREAEAWVMPPNAIVYKKPKNIHPMNKKWWRDKGATIDQMFNENTGEMVAWVMNSPVVDWKNPKRILQINDQEIGCMSHASNCLWPNGLQSICSINIRTKMKGSNNKQPLPKGVQKRSVWSKHKINRSMSDTSNFYSPNESPKRYFRSKRRRQSSSF